MASRRITVKECDVCGSKALTFRIAYPESGTVSIDLCEKHAAPLYELSEQGRSERRGRRIYTAEEIEAAEQRYLEARNGASA